MLQHPSKHGTLTQCWLNKGPASATLAHYPTNNGLVSRVFAGMNAVCVSVHNKYCHIKMSEVRDVWHDL